jgi:hypothetical protein
MSSELDLHVRGESTPVPSLVITLTNGSSKPLTLYRYGLPWGGRYSMIVVAVKTDAPGTPLETTFPIDDPGPGTLAIQPGETLTGQISLVDRFPEFLRALCARDLVVFWTWQAEPVDAVALARQGGWVLCRKVTPEAIKGRNP